MDRYQFPHITHISQCLEAIKGCDAFYVAERDRHTIINYYQMGNDTFPPVNVYPEWTKMVRPPEDKYDKIVHANHVEYKAKEPVYDPLAALRRECRGIVFGPDGTVIARRLHKFFNAGEHPEVAIEGINLNDEHVVLQKLDGSMITPIPIGEYIRWGTKMGLTEVGFQAEEFVAKSDRRYLDMAEYYVGVGWTPIFEWCSRKQRIVIDYPQDDLVLIAMRKNVTGEYLPWSYMEPIAKFWGIPLVNVWQGSLGEWKDPQDFVNGVSGEEGNEGYVVRFTDGHSVKVKSDWYVQIHRAKDSIMQEKRVVEMIMAENVDDVLPHLIDHDRKALSDFQTDFWKGLLKVSGEIAFVFGSWYELTKGDRKRFAIEAAINAHVKSVCFSLWEANCKRWDWNEETKVGKTLIRYDVAKTMIFEELKKRVCKNLGSQTAIDGARWMWDGVKWHDYLKGEEQ